MNGKKMYNSGCGKIVLILGCKSSGKTTKLITKLNSLSYSKKCSIITETPKNFPNGLHPRKGINIIKIFKKTNLLGLNIKSGVIGIDNGDLYDNIVLFCESNANSGVIVIVTSMNGGCKRELANGIKLLVPKCENIKLLSSWCRFCKSKAFFDICFDGEVIPVCSNCNIKVASKKIQHKKKSMKKKMGLIYH